MKEKFKNAQNLNDSFQSFVRNMDRLFSESPNQDLLQSMNNFFNQAKPFGGFPVELIENSAEYLIKAQLPGIKKEEIDLEITPQYVAIAINTREGYEGKQTHKKATRTIPLTKPTIQSKAEAQYQDGELMIRIPKEKGKKLLID